MESGKCINDANSESAPPVIVCVSSPRGGDLEEDDAARCKILKSLVRNGADVNARSVVSCLDGYSQSTAAIITASRGFVRCLRFLVESGADLTLTAPSGDTSLMMAVREGQLECVRYLTQHMPHPWLDHKNKEGRTASMMATAAGSDKDNLCLQQLIQSGADLEVQDNFGWTALVLATQGRSLEVVKILLEMGTLVNTRAQDGETPLMHACRQKSAEIVSLLLEYGAEVNTVASNGNTVLSVSRFKHIPTLLQHGLDLTISRRSQLSIHFSVIDGSSERLRTLVMNGFPPIDARTGNLPSKIRIQLGTTPMSPLAYALCCKRPTIAKYFITSRFLTRFDTVQLCRDRDIRQYLQELSNDTNSSYRLCAIECLQILDFLSAKPQSLLSLCLVTVSSVLSQDFALDFTKRSLYKVGWACTPTFRERVERLELPPSLKRELLHQTPYSAASSCSWTRISL